jgi:hypothetical protein
MCLIYDRLWYDLCDRSWYNQYDRSWYDLSDRTWYDQSSIVVQSLIDRGTINVRLFSFSFSFFFLNDSNLRLFFLFKRLQLAPFRQKRLHFELFVKTAQIRAVLTKRL